MASVESVQFNYELTTSQRACQAQVRNPLETSALSVILRYFSQPAIFLSLILSLFKCIEHVLAVFASTCLQRAMVRIRFRNLA